MKIKLLLVSKTSEKHLKEGIEHYSKRINKYCSLEIIEINSSKISSKMSFAEIKKKEAALILSKLNTHDFLVLLDDKGKRMDSESFSKKVEHWKDTVQKPIVFLVGGAYGFDEQIYKKADFKLSLSSMTFSHQIIRIIFLEQLYRAFTILNNEPYHHA